MQVGIADFGVEVSPLAHGVTLVSVSGELDLHTSDALRGVLEDIGGRGDQTVIIDLSAVEFLDSTALGMLIGQEKRLRAAGGRLALVFDDAHTKRVFEVTGLGRVLRRYRSLADALASLLPRAAETTEVEP